MSARSVLIMEVQSLLINSLENVSWFALKRSCLDVEGSGLDPELQVRNLHWEYEAYTGSTKRTIYVSQVYDLFSTTRVSGLFSRHNIPLRRWILITVAVTNVFPVNICQKKKKVYRE